MGYNIICTVLITIDTKSSFRAATGRILKCCAPFVCSFSSRWFQPVWKILMSQIGSFPQVGLKIKTIWNHDPVLFAFNFTASDFVAKYQSQRRFFWSVRSFLRQRLQVQVKKISYMRVVLNSFIWKTSSSPKQNSFAELSRTPCFSFAVHVGEDFKKNVDVWYPQIVPGVWSLVTLHSAAAALKHLRSALRCWSLLTFIGQFWHNKSTV